MVQYELRCQNGAIQIRGYKLKDGAWQAAENLGLKVMIIPEHSEHGLDLEAFKKSNHNLLD